MTQSKDIWRKIVVLAVVGGLVFWAISIATSLVPITVDYRVARWSAGNGLGWFFACWSGYRILNELFLGSFLWQDSDKESNSKIRNTKPHCPSHWHNPTGSPRKFWDE